MPQITVLGQVFKYAGRRMDYGGVNPVTLLSKSDRPNLSDAKPQRALTPDELQRWLAAVDDTHRLIFEFAADTGARVSEVLGIVWENVNLTEGEVSFTHQIDKNGRRVRQRASRPREREHDAARLRA